MDYSTRNIRRRRQLVIPKGLGQQAVIVNHESAFRGHLGAKKTEVRILRYFFWPGLCQDVLRFCHSCDVFFKNTRGKYQEGTTRVYAVDINMQFKSVAVDIVPLSVAVDIVPLSETGYRYIIILVDYATRYPEAVPFKKI